MHVVLSERFDTAHATQEAPTVKPDRISQEQADAIGEILRGEYETNPAFREIVNAKAAALEALTPRAHRPVHSSPVAAPAGEAPHGAAA